jgi:hypothetical protein
VFNNKIENNKYHTVRTVLNIPIKKIRKKSKNDTPNTYIYIHYCLLSWLEIGTSIKSGRVKLV